MEPQAGLAEKVANELILGVLLNACSSSVSIFDRHLRFLFAAGDGWKEKGLEPAILVGKTLFEKFPDELTKQVEPFYRRVLSGETMEFEFFLNGKSSTLYAAPCFNERGDTETLIAVERPSPAPQHSEVNLQEAVHEIITLWNSRNDAFLCLDSQWQFTYLNSEAQRILRRKATELIGKILWHEFPESVDSIVHFQYHKAIEKGVAVHFEMFYPPLEVWLEIHAYPSPDGLAVYFRDITRHKQAKAELHESHERYRLIFEEGPVAIALVSLEGQLVEVNSRLSQLLNYSSQELKSLEVADITHPDDMEADAHFMQQLFAGEISSYHLEKRYLTKDRQVVWGALTASLIRNEAGKPLYGLGILEDISDRKRAEESRHQSQQFLQSLIDSLASHIAVLDEHGNILTVNRCWQYFARDNGGSEQNCGIGVNYLDVCDRTQGQWVEEAAAVADAIRAIIAGEREDFHLEYPCHTSQEKLWFQVNITKFDGDGPVRVVVAHENITKQKLVELELAEKETKFRTVFECVQDAILLSDNSGSYIEANPAACELLGRSREEILGCKAQNFVAPEMWPAISALREKFLREGQQRGELKFVRPDGSRRIVEFSAVANFLPGNHLSLLHDITERRRAEENQARLATIVESSHDAIISKTLEGIITSWNRGAEQIYGYRSDEVIGQHMSMLLPTELHHEEEEILKRLKRGESIPTFETRRVRKDGEIIDAAISSSPILDASGDIIGASSIARDITERKRAENALRASEERFHGIVTNVPGMVYQFVLNPDGSVEWPYVSEGCRELFGVEPEDFQTVPTYLLTYILPDDLSDFNQSIAVSAVNLTPWIWEGRYLTLTGEVRWIQGTSRPQRLPNGGTLWNGMIMDITARKEAEAERERFFALSLDLLCVVDKEGFFQRINPAFETILGHTSTELIGKQALDFVHPDDLEASKKSMTQLAEGKPVINFVNRWLCHDGSYKNILWATAPFENQLYGAGRDITNIKIAESELAHSLALLEATLESTADGILVVDDKGQMARWNQQFVTMWHIPADIIESNDNQRAIEFVKDQLNDPEEFEASSYELLSDSERSAFDLLHFKDGRVFERYSKIQQLNDHAVGRVWSFRNVTERYKAIQEQGELTIQVEHQRRRLDDILSNVPGVVWENSIELGTTEQKALYVSKYVETMLGYSQSEWLSKPDFWTHALHPNDRERTFAQSAELIQNGQSGVLRYRMVRKDGDTIWTETHCAVVLNEQGESIGLRGVTMDITDRMQAEEEQSRLAGLLESTSDFVGWADTDGCMQYINPAGRRMLGWELDEAAEGQHLTVLSPPWANEIILNTGIPQASQKGSWSGETALLARDGREIPVSQVITAHKDFEGHDIFYSTIARDISESKRVRAILERSNEELEERVGERTAALETAVKESQMARKEAEQANLAKSEFLSRMSHELRTPLNAILGFGQILEMRNLAQKENEGVKQILKAGRHLLQLINEVLEIARIEAGRLSISIEPVEVLPLLRETLTLMQPLAMQRHISLVNECESITPPRKGCFVQADRPPRKGCFVQADRQRLNQVLLNLLSNAIKYNREGGTVTLSLQEVGRHEDASSNYWRIMVRDTGPGIASADQTKIFIPFERNGAEKTNIEGTGIGLSLVQRLMELMNGHIGIQSIVGQGSTFWIDLPVAQSPLSRLEGFRQKTGPATESLLAIDRPLTFLYIEDNASNLGVMETLTKEMPQVRLLTAIQGSIGLELARQHRPDLILLDLHLPDIQGDEVFQELQSHPKTRSIPVIIVSADATRKQIDKLLAAGVKRYITKPFDVKDLVNVLETVLREE